MPRLGGGTPTYFPPEAMERLHRHLQARFEFEPDAEIGAGVILMILLGFLFFRFSGGTGCSVFFVLGVGACVMCFFSPVLHLLSLPIVLGLIIWNEWSLARRKRHYMAPIAQTGPVKSPNR